MKFLGDDKNETYKVFFLIFICIFIWILNVNVDAYAYAYENNGTNIISHRGLSGDAPENTLAAFNIPSSYKIYAAECDIRETIDNEFVIMHDDTVDRMTNGTGKVNEMTLSQIKNLTIDAGNNVDKYFNLTVPTLQEYLQICNQCSIIPVIEIKNINEQSINKFLDILNQYNVLNKVIIISFDKNVLSAIKNINKNIKIQWLCDMAKENIDICAENGFDIDVSKDTFNIKLLSYAHNKNIKVNVWTIDDPIFANTLIGYGVDYITSNSLMLS